MKQPKNEVWIGRRGAFGTGERRVIELDVMGNTVVFWSRSRRGPCHMCRGEGDRADYDGHLVQLVESRVVAGIKQVRRIRYCPRKGKPAWPEPSWNTALS